MAIIINKDDVQSLYIKWLKAAYIYYWGFGEDTGYEDYRWDTLSRYFYNNRSHLPKEDFPVIHDERFTGASLYWLSKSEYPEEALQ
jgi:hypothetical protein